MDFLVSIFSGMTRQAVLKSAEEATPNSDSKSNNSDKASQSNDKNEPHNSNNNNNKNNKNDKNNNSGEEGNGDKNGEKAENGEKDETAKNGDEGDVPESVEAEAEPEKEQPPEKFAVDECWDSKMEDIWFKEVKTAPFDPRFPNQNQTKYCYQSFLDYHRCRKIKGTDYQPCSYFKKCYTSLCPMAWVEKWEDQLENGTFPGKI